MQLSSVQLLSCAWLFVTPWTAVCQASLSITNSWSLLKLLSIDLVTPSNYLIFCHPFLLPSIFPSSKVFWDESILHMRWPKYWSFSLVSVLSMNAQDWSPLGLTGLISLPSKGLSRVFSSTTVGRHGFSGAQSFLLPSSHIHTTEKTIALTLQTFVGKEISLLFNMLSSFVIAFLPRSKQASFNFMAAFTIEN